MVLQDLVEQSYWLRMSAVAVSTLLSALWLRAVSRYQPLAGSAAARLRLAAAAPVVALNAAAPLIFRRGPESVTIAFCGFIITWLCSFKALALAAGRGPLAQKPWSPLQFWVLYVLPIVPASAAPADPRVRQGKPQQEGSGTALSLLFRWLAKVAVTAAIVFFLLHDGLPPLLRTACYALGIYGMLGVVMDGPAALVLRPLRLTLAPHFMPPWQATSLPDFWGTRWNLAAGNALRTTVYDPIVEGCLLSSPLPGPTPAAADKGRRRSARLMTASGKSAAGTHSSGGSRGGGMGGARLAGMSASFLASGLIHELIFWYVHGAVTDRLAWLFFFAGQVPLILGERWLLAKLKQGGILVPRLARSAVTLTVLLGTTHCFFFAPAESAGMPALFAARIRQSFSSLASGAGHVLTAAGLGLGRG